MADERTRDPERPPMDKDARRAERARLYRLSRLPGLYDLAARGRWQSVVATLLQTALAIVLALLPVRLIAGRWLPTGVALVVLAVAFALQGLARYLNARAGRA